MPELPEVETIARGLQSLVAGATIQAVSVSRPDVLRVVGAQTFRRRLKGVSITRSFRRAKLAVLELSSGDFLAVQPRFTGALLVESSDAPLPERDRDYSTLFLTLVDGRRLHYVDVRRLGTVSLFTASQFAQHSGALGVEPLAPEFTPDLLSGLLRGSRTPVKKLIMNQYKLAGVGNIYANEALWRSRIDPSRSSHLISAQEAKVLHANICTVLREAIDARGTSFRDYKGATGEAGGYAIKLDAYGREGLDCRRCGSRLIGTHVIDGRATVLCARCQS